MTLIMFDSVDPALFPDPAKVPFDATAGYVNGKYPSSAGIRKRFPDLPHLSISVTSTGVADCCDVEVGDLTPDQVPGWVDNYWNRRLPLPVVYGSDPAIRTYMGSRPYLAWNANWTYKPHIDSGYDATQWTDPPPPQGTAPAGTLRGVDQSQISDAFYANLVGDTMALTQADIDSVVKAVLDAPIVRQPGNDSKNTTSLRAVAAYYDANATGSRDSIIAAIKALPTPPTAAEIATAVLNEDHRRSES